MVADREQVCDHGDLVRHLLTTQDRHEWPLRLGDRIGEILDLLLHQKPDQGRLAEGLHCHGHRVHARLGAVAGAEGIVDVGIGQTGEAIDIGLVVPLLLTLVEPHVLEHKHAAGRQGLGFGVRIGATGVAGQRHRLTEQFAEPLGDGGERKLRLKSLSGRPAQVRHENRPATAVEDRLDRRQRHADPPVVGDRPGIILRDVEVDADENRLALGIDAGDGLLGHGGNAPGRVWLGMSWVSGISSGSRLPEASRAVFDPHPADRATGGDLVSLALGIAVADVR